MKRTPYETPRITGAGEADAYTDEKIDRRFAVGKEGAVTKEIMTPFYDGTYTPGTRYELDTLPDAARQVITDRYPTMLTPKPNHTLLWSIQEAPLDSGMDVAELRIIIWDTDITTNENKIIHLELFRLVTPLQQIKAVDRVRERTEAIHEAQATFVDYAIAHTGEHISAADWEEVDDLLYSGFRIDSGKHLPADGYAELKPIGNKKNGFNIRFYDASNKMVWLRQLDFDNPTWE